MTDVTLVREFKQNFLSRPRWRTGMPWALGYILVCLVFSHLEWSGIWTTSASRELALNKGEWWRLFTSALVHGDLKHLLNNSFMLAIMGYFVNSFYSPLVHPVASILAGGLINAIVLSSYPDDVRLVGASGVVFFLWGFWLVLYLFIQRHIGLLRRIMKVSIVGMFVLIPSEFQPHVSYQAHAVGMMLGVLLGIPWWFVRKSWFLSFEQYRIREIVEPDYADEAENA